MKIGPNNPQSLSRDQYRISKDHLNGIFRLRTSIVFAHIEFPNESIVFLKNGLPHNENGPAILSAKRREDEGGGHLLGTYSINGEWIQVDNKPNSIAYATPYIWNGSFYTPPDSEITEFKFRNQDGKLHNLLGPAFFHQWGTPKNKYYIEGKQLLPKQWQKHPLVINEHNRIELKKVMNESFKE